METKPQMTLWKPHTVGVSFAFNLFNSAMIKWANVRYINNGPKS